MLVWESSLVDLWSERHSNYSLLEHDLRETTKLSWEKAKLGLDQLCEKYPKSIYWKSARAFMAWSAQDTKAFKDAMTALNGTYDPWAIKASQFPNLLNSFREK